MNPDFWSGRRVMVTGHTGFKGSWLSLWLESLGAHVTGYALAPNTVPNLFEISETGRNIHSILGDVRDPQSVSRAIATGRPDIVIHMAAQALVRTSYADPVGTYATNVMGTVHVLDAVRRADHVRSVVIVTSDKCYENYEWERGYRESDPMGGHDPYSSSKGCAELVTAAYRRSYFSEASSNIGVASARAGNVIGGGDWSKDRLIPDIMTAFAAGRPVEIRHPDAARPWQHVLEPLAGYLSLAERLYHSPRTLAEAWNFGPDDSDTKPVSWVATRLADLWGEGTSWRPLLGKHLHEATTLKLDCSKTRARLGWMPRLDLPTALEWVVEWYRGFHSGSDVRRLTLDQIARYNEYSAV